MINLTPKAKPVAALVGLSLAVAVTVLLWIDNQTLHWITQETVLLRGGATGLALWLLVVGHAHNQAKVRWLREEMKSVRLNGTNAGAGQGPSVTRARYAMAWGILLLALATTVAYRFQPDALLWLTPEPHLAARGAATGLVWLAALAVASGSHRLRRLTVEHRGFLESEELGLEMMESVPVMVCVCMPDGTRTRFNRHSMELTGKTEEQLFGRGWLESVHADDRERFEALFAHPSGKVVAMEYGLTAADGQNRWIREHIVPRFTPDGGVRHYIVTGIDVTAQTQNDTEHEETIARQRDEISELERKRAAQTKALEAQHGAEIDGLVRSHTEDLDSIRKRHADEVDTLKRRSREDVDALKKQHRAEASDLKKQVKTLTESRERFEARFQEARESATNASEQLAVFRADIAKAQADLKAAHAEQQQFKLENRQLHESIDKLQTVVEDMASGDEERRREQEHSEKQIEHAKAAATEARRSESQLRAKVNRLTERVQRLEEELETAQTSRAQQEDEMRTQIDTRNRDLAEELRPQLQAVLDVSRRLQESALDETQLTALDGARASTTAMARLVEGALGSERADRSTRSDDTSSSARPFDLRAAVTSTCEQVRSADAMRDVAVRTVIHPDFPARVNADPISLREAVIHLLRRAAAVVDDGTITVVLSDQGTTMSHVAARCEIKHDTARFDAEELQELFALRESPTSIEGGEDVGRYRAAVAWQLIREMNGDFDANPRPEGGFVIGFTVSLPKFDVASAPAPSAPAPGAPAPSVPELPVCAPNAPTPGAGAPASPRAIALAVDPEAGVARREAPRVPQEDLASSLGPVLELGQDSARVRCARVPREPVRFEVGDAGERLALSAGIVSTESAGRHGHDVVLRFVDATPAQRRQMLEVALAHRKH